MKISNQEIDNVSKLPAVERYSYFVKRVADFEILYSLIDNSNNLALSEIEGRKMLSFWTAPEFATICAIKEWQDYSTKEISLEEFEEEYIDIIELNNYLINIFPTVETTGFVVDVNEFARDLSEEMKKYH
jgi:hypothetical protein